MNTYAEQMYSKYGAITTWVELARANRAEGWPLPLYETLVKAYSSATPEQRLTAVRRSVRLAVEAQIARWPSLATEASDWAWWTPTVTALRERLLAWADGGDEDVGRIYRAAFDTKVTVLVRVMPKETDSNYQAYTRARPAYDSVTYDAEGFPDAAAAQAAYEIADIAASSVSADEPLVRYLASRGGHFVECPIRGSLDHEALLADGRGARAAARAALGAGKIATTTASKDEADWAAVEYICGLLDAIA